MSLAATITHIPGLQLPLLEALELIEMLGPTGEAEEVDAPLISRWRKTVDPLAVNDLRPPPVEEKVVESQSGADGEAANTQSFAFDAGIKEEALVKALVEQVQKGIERWRR